MTAEKLDKIMEEISGLKKEVSSIKELLSKRETESPIVNRSQNTERNESFMEFFRRYKPKKDTEKALVIMKFLETHRGISNINSKNIAEGFREVREKPPQNVADKIQSLHKKGFVMPGEIVDGLKGWVITRSGLEYLEEMKNDN